MSLGTRNITVAAISTSVAVPIYVENTAMVQVSGVTGAWGAKLAHLTESRPDGDHSPQSTALGDYEDLNGDDGSALAFGSTVSNYIQTFGGGNYALVFTSGSGAATISITEAR
jgi:hypothetical protein